MLHMLPRNVSFEGVCQCAHIYACQISYHIPVDVVQTILHKQKSSHYTKVDMCIHNACHDYRDGIYQAIFKYAFILHTHDKRVSLGSACRSLK